MDILRAEVHIATLTPEREYSKGSLNDIGSLLEPLIIFMRAHEESKTKSERLEQAWSAKRNRLQKEVLTAKAPQWCQVKEDRSGFDLIPDRAAAVRTMFEWSASGMGVNAITKRLNQSVPAIGKKGAWHRSYVLKILRNRAVIGEYQPHRGHAGPNRKPIGKPIPGYYPAVVEEPLFYAVQAGLKSRRKMCGRAGQGVANLFTGLVRDARDDSTLTMVDKGEGRQLVSSKAQRGLPGSRYMAFSYDLFERAFLDFVRDVTPADVTPPQATKRQDELTGLEGKIAELENKIDRTKLRVASDPDVDVILDVLMDLERQKKRLVGDLERVRGQAAISEAKTLSDAKSILELLREADGEELELLRCRLRQKIRNLVSGILVCVWEEKARWHPVARQRETTFRFVQVQVTFSNGESQFFFLENKTRMYLGPKDKVPALSAVPNWEREQTMRFDLAKYSGWYDTPIKKSPIWLSPWRWLFIQIAIVKMKEKSRDKRLDGMRAPTQHETEAMKEIAGGKGGSVHWRTLGSLIRRGWASNDEGQIALTPDGIDAQRKFHRRKRSGA